MPCLMELDKERIRRWKTPLIVVANSSTIIKIIGLVRKPSVHQLEKIVVVEILLVEFGDLCAGNGNHVHAGGDQVTSIKD